MIKPYAIRDSYFNMMLELHFFLVAILYVNKENIHVIISQ